MHQKTIINYIEFVSINFSIQLQQNFLWIEYFKGGELQRRVWLGASLDVAVQKKQGRMGWALIVIIYLQSKKSCVSCISFILETLVLNSHLSYFRSAKTFCKITIRWLWTVVPTECPASFTLVFVTLTLATSQSESSLKSSFSDNCSHCIFLTTMGCDYANKFHFHHDGDHSNFQGQLIEEFSGWDL